MKNGKMLKSGDVILTKIQFVDTLEIKTRPALVLFEEFGNVVVAGITSDKKMQGIPLLRKEGAIKDSVIKLNYIFTISRSAIFKILFHLNSEKKKTIFNELTRKLEFLIN